MSNPVLMKFCSTRKSYVCEVHAAEVKTNTGSMTDGGKYNFKQMWMAKFLDLLSDASVICEDWLIHN
jgi:hypothetical protein